MLNAFGTMLFIFGILEFLMVSIFWLVLILILLPKRGEKDIHPVYKFIGDIYEP